MNIKEASKTLKLSYLRENHEEILEEAKNLKLTNREFLELYLERELERRQNNGITRRIKRELGKSIEERPLEIEDRKTFGNWEIDTVVPRKKKEE